jgi:hypothetical protein
VFYTTGTDDGAIAVTCDQCFQSLGCPDPWAAAAAITHHQCDPTATLPNPQDPGPAVDDERPPALHLLAGRWVASCRTCGFQLASAQSQARCERRAARQVCPVCHQDAS